MKRWPAIAVLAAALANSACSHMSSGEGWITLLDGTSLEGWYTTGNSNWRIENGLVVADRGNGLLVAKKTYADFQLHAEFWIDEDANSGIYVRGTDSQKISSATAYEINIFDKRPDPTYGTGAIVGVAKVSPMPKAGGRWNVYDITVQGERMVVVLNGVQTADVRDGKHMGGVLALQHGEDAVQNRGVVKFRKLLIRPL